jgi:hypothetical protein
VASRDRADALTQPGSGGSLQTDSLIHGALGELRHLSANNKVAARARFTRSGDHGAGAPCRQLLRRYAILPLNIAVPGSLTGDLFLDE